MGASQSADESQDFETFSEVDETEGEDTDLVPRNEEAELAILNDFVEALVDVAPPTWPPMA